MTWWSAVRSWFNAPAVTITEPLTLDSRRGQRFSVDSGAIPADIFGLTSYEDPINPVARVTRAEAIQVPAVKRGRDLIAGTIGTIPFTVLDTENIEHVSPLLSQPERACARSITMTRTVEDLVFEAVSWWKVTERDFRNYPVKAERLPVRSVFFDTVKKQWYVDRAESSWTLAAGQELSGNSARREYLNDRDLIRFDSPTDGILKAGARAIRTYLKLVTAADRYADEPMPSGYFTPRPDASPDETDMESFLSDWQTARVTRATGYVPAEVVYQTVQWTPEQLQMDQARAGAVSELARLFGVDPEDLGVSTTSRTYQNAQDRRIAMINDTLGMYISALAGRLSMGDVTPRGYRVAADFNGFLRADDKTRLETYAVGLELGLYDRDQIAAREGLPRPMFAPPTPNVSRETSAPTVSRETSALAASTAPGDSAEFALSTPFDGFYPDEPAAEFSVDPEARTISGLAVPFGVIGTLGEHRFQVVKGSLTWGDPSRVKLLIQHDHSQAVGRAVELSETSAGVFAKFKVARTAEGDRALALAADGVYDGLSVGFGNRSGAKFDTGKDGVITASQGQQLEEVSLTPLPVFDSARVSAVHADISGRNEIMENQDTAVPAVEAAPAAFDMDKLVEALATRLAPANGPEVIPAHGAAATFEVSEPDPYVIDKRGTLRKGAFDFSTDLINMERNRDHDARSRVLGFLAAQFDIDTADVNEANPTGNRPDLYVDQKAYQFPLWNAVSKGSLTDITPFTIPAFSSATTLVAAHVEGVAPTAGTFVSTAVTVTPAALSGKVEITREVWDQGGNPLVSNLIWQKMVRAYYEALEAKVVTVLDAASPTGITLTAGGGTTGQTASAELASAFAALQYIRGGFSFDTFAAQVDLYKLLSGALDGNKRPLFPILGPSNANGTSAPRFAQMDVHGVPVFPAWALAATGSAPASSYLFDRNDVFAAASAPQRLEFQYRVEYVDLAVWGYLACAITDLTGVREVIYDPVP